MAFITFLRSPLGGYAVAAVVAVGFIIRILFMQIHITGLEADNKTLKGNVETLEAAVGDEKMATATVQALLQTSLGTSNALVARNEEINNGYIAQIQENARLARDLRASIIDSPVRAARDVNDRFDGLLMDFWRPRAGADGPQGADRAQDRARSAPEDGAEARGPDADRDQ